VAPRTLNEVEVKEHLFKRFWNKVLLGDDCWEWTAWTKEGGYGMLDVRINGEWKHKVASIVSWFLHTGEWPTLQVLHKCDNPPCVRFSHLFLGTQLENVRDCIAKGRARKAHPTVCKRGHDLADAYVKNGRRHCKICRRDWKRERRASVVV
jgi:hypothetical protein